MMSGADALFQEEVTVTDSGVAGEPARALPVVFRPNFRAVYVFSR